MHLNNRLMNQYFYWLCNLVKSTQNISVVKYDKLLTYLFNTPYYATIDDDINRINDGYNFRYHLFSYYNDLDQAYTTDQLCEMGQCRMLELLVSFAYRIEDDIMSDETQGDRIGQWFWSMIVSLGLGKMDDSHFNEQYCDLIIKKFIEHRYNKNGKGGLFTFENNDNDMRNVSLWCQAMWYLNENFDFSSWLGGSM